jgi:hypothetical protein
VDSHRPSKDEAILTSVAESIGSTLGTIAAKAGAVQKAFTKKVAAAKPRVRRAVKKAAKGRRSRGKRAGNRRATLARRRAKRKL